MFANNPSVLLFEMCNQSNSVWVDCFYTEDIEIGIEQLKARSQNPDQFDWYVGYTGDMYGLTIPHTIKDIDTLAHIGTLVYYDGEKAVKLLEQFDCDADKVRYILDDGFIGEFDSLEHFGREVLHDRYRVPSEIEDYIDYHQYASDYLLDNYEVSYIEVNGSLIFFHD